MPTLQQDVAPLVGRRTGRTSADVATGRCTFSRRSSPLMVSHAEPG
ncbi:hypothetical protein J9303_19510 [Bacillaceae bacterium Marseille-Q3522]|nr:hypothetical protein [Bacillaceae bacterium Marseille-Q3522]